MCFHISQTKRTEELEIRFQVKRSPVHEITDDQFTFYHSNGFEHREIPIITQQKFDVIKPAIWGIMPEYEQFDNRDLYYKKAAKWGAGLNARSEKLFDHFIYSEAIDDKRCLILIDGFFEPFKDEKNVSYPYYVRRKDREAIALAGIYSELDDGTITTSILTRDADPFMAKIHNKKLRQPVILNKEWERTWIEEDLSKYQIEEYIKVPYRYDELDAFTVTKDVLNSHRPSNIPQALEEKIYIELT